MQFTEHIPRLPVTLKTTESPTTPITPANTYLPVPPNVYLPPGPPHIYAPNQIPTVAKPPNVYLPATTTPKPTKPTYLPPANPTTPTTPRPPVKPDNAYLPAEKPSNAYLPAEKPTNVYLPAPGPAQNSSSIFLPPVKPSPASPPSINLEILPPAIPTDTCGSSLSCCEEATEGKIVIPIPLKSYGSSGCCGRVAKLILPVSGLDKESIRKLSTSLPEEIDASLLIKNILQNLL